MTGTTISTGTPDSERSCTERGSRVLDTTGDHLYSGLVHRWRDLDLHGRLRAAVGTAQAHGGWAFSLNLSFGRQGGAFASKEPARNLGKRLSEALGRHGLSGLPVAFVIEAEPETGRPHLHGVVAGGELTRVQIERALAEFGGKVSGPARARQCMLKRIHDAEGWFRYVTKDLMRTTRELDGRLIYISRPMVQLARSDHQELLHGGVPDNSCLVPSSSPRSRKRRQPSKVASRPRPVSGIARWK